MALKKEKAAPEYVGATSEGREPTEQLCSQQSVHFPVETTRPDPETHPSKE